MEMQWKWVFVEQGKVFGSPHNGIPVFGRDVVSRLMSLWNNMDSGVILIKEDRRKEGTLKRLLRVG